MPAVPAKDAATPAPLDTTPATTSAVAPVDTAAPKIEETPTTVTPKAEKENIFNKFLNKEKAKTPTSETPVTPVEPKDAAPATTETTETAPAATTATPTPELAKEKRRTSFFGNLGGSVKKIQKPEPSTEAETAEGEQKHSSPISTFGSLFRNPSKAMKGNKKDKEPIPEVPSQKADETTEKSAEDKTVAPIVDDATADKHKETAPANASAVTNEKPNVIGDVVPDAVSVGQPKPVSSPAVQAAA